LANASEQKQNPFVIKIESPANTGGKVFAGRCWPKQDFVLSGRANVSNSFPAILRRVENPVEPFGLMFVQDCLTLPLLDGLPDAPGNQADLFDQFNDGQPEQFQCLHA
jgi:hypothetical protein